MTLALEATSGPGGRAEVVLYDLPIGGTAVFWWGDWSGPETVAIDANPLTGVAHTYPWATTFTLDVHAFNPDGTFFGSGRAVVVIWAAGGASWGDNAVAWANPATSWSGGPA